MSAAKQKAQQIIDSNSVVVFSKSYCPYCKASKALLNEKGAKYFLMELDQVGKSIIVGAIADCEANTSFGRGRICPSGRS